MTEVSDLDNGEVLEGCVHDHLEGECIHHCDDVVEESVPCGKVEGGDLLYKAHACSLCEEEVECDLETGVCSSWNRLGNDPEDKDNLLLEKENVFVEGDCSVWTNKGETFYRVELVIGVEINFGVDDLCRP